MTIRTTTLRLRRVRFHRSEESLFGFEVKERLHFGQALKRLPGVVGLERMPAVLVWDGPVIKVIYADDLSPPTRAQGWVS